MTIEERLLNLDNNQVLDRDDLYRLIKEIYPNYKDNSVRWVIHRLVRNGIIGKLDSTKYIIGKTKHYHQQETSV